MTIRDEATAAHTQIGLANLRREHAEWSQETFGDIGPSGPLVHLSREALEAAAQTEDVSEYVDCQFLLWDALRRAGIHDLDILAAGRQKLAKLRAREWGTVEDGKPIEHIKKEGNSRDLRTEALLRLLEASDDQLPLILAAIKHPNLA